MSFFTLFYCLLDLTCGECDVLSLFLSVDPLMYLFVFCFACL